MGLSRAGLAQLSAVLPGPVDGEPVPAPVEGARHGDRYGITTVVEPQNSPDDLALFARARDEGAMRSRVIAAMFHPVGTTDAEVDEFDEARRAYTATGSAAVRSSSTSTT